MKISLFKIFVYFSFSFFTSFSFSIQENLYFKQAIETAKHRCFPTKTKQESLVFSFGPNWFISLDEIKKLFEIEYETSHKLSTRVYYELEQDIFFLPQIDPSYPLIPLTENFIINVMMHIEMALEQKYADYIHFADMGHSHVFIPIKYYEQEIINTANSEIYNKILNHKESKFIYHTAERLKMIKDRVQGEQITFLDDNYLKHRYLTRNIIGNNKQVQSLEVVQVDNLKETYNTVRSLENYKWWGSGYSIRSNKKACFPYKKAGKTYYFDISFEDPPSVY